MRPNHHLPRRHRALAFVLAPALLLTACGSDGESSADGSTDSSAVEQDDGVDVFDTSVVHEVSMSYDQEDYDAMIETFTETGEKDWIEVTVTIDGETYERAGARLKGNSSLAGLGGGFGPGGGFPPGQTTDEDETTDEDAGETDHHGRRDRRRRRGRRRSGGLGGGGRPRGPAVADPSRRVRRRSGPPGLRGPRRPLERLGDVAQRGGRPRPARGGRPRLPGSGRRRASRSTTASRRCG